jgi:hypothetical protein
MGFLDDKQKERITEFVKFVKGELELKSAPKVVLQNGKNQLKTTASYDYTKPEKIIRVNAKNRMTVDIMRSIAHEMVHHKQYEQGRLTNSVKDGEDGSDIENEAHAIAGFIIRKYGKLNDSIYDELK